MSDFEFIGSGWCRPDGCDVMKDRKCRVDGYFKDQVDFNECLKSCLEEPTCTGFAYSNEQHHKVPNRCFVHGNTSWTGSFSDWDTFSVLQEFLPTKASGHENSKCWRRKGMQVLYIIIFGPKLQSNKLT